MFDTALKELVNASLKIALEHCLSTVYCLMVWEIPFNYSFIIRQRKVLMELCCDYSGNCYIMSNIAPIKLYIRTD